MLVYVCQASKEVIEDYCGWCIGTVQVCIYANLSVCLTKPLPAEVNLTKPANLSVCLTKPLPAEVNLTKPLVQDWSPVAPIVAANLSVCPN